MIWISAMVLSLFLLFLLADEIEDSKRVRRLMRDRWVFSEELTARMSLYPPAQYPYLWPGRNIPPIFDDIIAEGTARGLIKIDPKAGSLTAEEFGRVVEKRKIRFMGTQLSRDQGPGEEPPEPKKSE